MIRLSPSMIWGSDGGEYVDGCLLGWSCLDYQGPGDGGSADLWNVGKLTPIYTALQPTKQLSF
jgi:hypothetical protein